MFSLGSTVLFLACATSFVAATVTERSSSCRDSEFWYESRSCCLPHGGPVNTGTPPSGVQCPPTNWYWHSGQGCCVPRHQEPPSRPPPQCNRGWSWNKNRQCCDEDHTPTQPPPSTPSHYPGSPSFPGLPGFPGGGGKWWKRSRMAPLCPQDSTACPVSGADDYECLDTTVELESCGGCASTGEGQDCTAIEGAWNVGCENSRCRVFTCSAGFKISDDGSFCQPL